MRIALPASIILIAALQSAAHPLRLDSRSPNAAAGDDSDSSTKRPRYSVVPVDGGDGDGDSPTVTITHPHSPTTVTHRLTDTVTHHKPTTVVAVVPVDGNDEEEVQTEQPPSVTLSVPQSSEPTTSELASPTSHDAPESDLPSPSSSSIFSSASETTVPAFTSTSSAHPVVDPIPESTFVSPPPQETKPVDEDKDEDVIHEPVPAPSAGPWHPEPELSSSSLSVPESSTTSSPSSSSSWLPEFPTTSSLPLESWEPEPEPEPTLPVWTETYDVTPPAITSFLDDGEWYQPPVWPEVPAWPEASSSVEPTPEAVATSSPVLPAPEPVETSTPVATPVAPTTLLTVTSSAPALEQFGTPAHDDGLWDPSRYPASVDTTWGRVRR